MKVAIPSAGHLGQPIVVAALGPVLGLVAARNTEDSDFVAFAVQILKTVRN